MAVYTPPRVAPVVPVSLIVSPGLIVSVVAPEAGTVTAAAPLMLALTLVRVAPAARVGTTTLTLAGEGVSYTPVSVMALPCVAGVEL